MNGDVKKRLWDEFNKWCYDKSIDGNNPDNYHLFQCFAAGYNAARNIIMPEVEA